MNGDELFPQSFINYAAPFVNVPVTDVIAGSAVGKSRIHTGSENGKNLIFTTSSI